MLYGEPLSSERENYRMTEEYKEFLKGTANRPYKKTFWCNSSEVWMVVHIVVVLALLIKSFS